MFGRFFAGVLFNALAISLAFAQEVAINDLETLYRFLADKEFYGVPIMTTLKGDSCEDALSGLRRHTLDKPSDGRSLPITCETINAVWKLHSGEDYYWKACMPSQGRVGSAEHIEQCLAGFAKRFRDAIAFCS